MEIIHIFYIFIISIYLFIYIVLFIKIRNREFCFSLIDIGCYFFFNINLLSI